LSMLHASLVHMSMAGVSSTQGPERIRKS